MQFIAYCTVLFFLSTGCHCNLDQQQNKWNNNASINASKCLDTLIAITEWAVNGFVVIFNEIDAIEFDLFKRQESSTWEFINSEIDPSTTLLTGFSNVILFANSFDSLRQIMRAINIRSMDIRSKYVIVISENFEDPNDIKKSSVGIGPAMWKLDRTRVVYLVPCKEEIFAMTYFPFARDCEPGELEVLDVWRDGGFKNGAELFSEKMLDVRGCVQNHFGIFDESSDLQGRKVLTETGELKLGGVGGELIAIVAQKMNMKLRLLPEEPDHWLILLDKIAKGESLFWLAGNIPVADQLEVLDIGSGFMEESLAFGYFAEGYEVSWKNLVWPLSHQVWLYTIFTFVLFCALIILANLIHRRKKIINFENLRILDVFGVFLGGSRPLRLRNNFGRCSLGIWIFYSYLITAAYNCGLVSFLTTPNEKRVINTLEELLEDGMNFGGERFHKECYNDPSDPVMMKIYDKFNIWSSDEAARIVEAREGATGFFASSLYAYSRNRTGFDNRLRFLKEKAFTFLVPISMRRGSPFVIPVRRYASRAIQGGLHNYWLDHYTRESRLAVINTKFPMRISIRHIRGILCLHIAGLSFGLLIFIGEIIYEKYLSTFRYSLIISLIADQFLLTPNAQN